MKKNNAKSPVISSNHQEVLNELATKVINITPYRAGGCSISIACPFCNSSQYGHETTMKDIKHSADCGFELAAKILKEGNNDRTN